MKVKVISLPYIFQVLYVLCFTNVKISGERLQDQWSSGYREDTTQTEMLIEEVEDDNPSFVRRPRRLTRSRHVDIRNFLSSFGKLLEKKKKKKFIFQFKKILSFENIYLPMIMLTSNA